MIMKKDLLFGLLGSMLLTSCSVLTPEPANQQVDALYNRFHGKYSAVSSTSSEAIDANLDGVASTNMLTEFPVLASVYEYNLELLIRPLTGRSGEVRFLFTQTWPVQFIRDTETTYWQGQPLAYNPALTVSYAPNGPYGKFTFSPDLTSLVPDANPAYDETFRWQKAASMTVVGEHAIEVVNKRPVYTRMGVKNITITTRYERFTSTT
jgi:hypothetical protein